MRLNYKHGHSKTFCYKALGLHEATCSMTDEINTQVDMVVVVVNGRFSCQVIPSTPGCLPRCTTTILMQLFISPALILVRNICNEFKTEDVNSDERKGET